MKNLLKGYLLGLLSTILIVGGVAYAANTVRIVVDGREIHPTDANGNSVSPIVQNGTTYLPVRAVADALGKAVYWDGPNYTVYIGEMDGALDYPTVELNVDDNIGDYFWDVSRDLKDNYGNIYSHSIYCDWNNYDVTATYEKLCNMKYSRFKGTIYVVNGASDDDMCPNVMIKADGRTIYTSPEMTKSSAPIPIDIDISGCNNFQIILTQRTPCVQIGDAGFYQ